MNEENAFETRFREAQLEDGHWRTASTDDYLAMWRELVALCEDGYDDITDEYEFDLQARDALEIALNDPALNEHEEISELRARVFEIDARIRDILCDHPVKNPDSHPWWNCYIPRFGRRDFAEDVYSRYGLSIRIVD
ncbi:hypothetical protein FHR84_001944 [Actinopolyspora biskrensis]|uniref:Uncharacterized protein n=1 Tax=Actinopolyspora biskrensis TaxID=1470178 RepID=A0A852YYL5_9ACTN|nr:hypothetical protein [Actinopolyspora biskrensis]NYH78619.1 hypothetical protein [Actinopolyspora biskrensis]